MLNMAKSTVIQSRLPHWAQSVLISCFSLVLRAPLVCLFCAGEMRASVFTHQQVNDPSTGRHVHMDNPYMKVRQGVFRKSRIVVLNASHLLKVWLLYSNIDRQIQLSMDSIPERFVWWGGAAQWCCSPTNRIKFKVEQCWEHTIHLQMKRDSHSNASHGNSVIPLQEDATWSAMRQLLEALIVPSFECYSNKFNIKYQGIMKTLIENN